ncbi:hypothetical protein JIN85_15025 [Luteolibacter pohnpeiensis]|uniref:Porin n=1 Tax=Luteolibacter pohnpeiensis TaxID=454153 RepID=A0A934VXQ4_9BACT|nr:porin [Luteolibacter pohnpeiensis]MBK1883729.1 hypothetical protein [Luteolibacter pohnpeiensis]
MTTTRSIAILLSLAAPCLAGEAIPTSTEHVEIPASWDFCNWIQNKPGLLYSNPENPLLQSFQIGGRFHYQMAYEDGNDVNGRDFNDTYEDYRRARIETKTHFLQYFSAKLSLNLVDDDRRDNNDLDWGYESFDEAVFSFDIKKAFAGIPLDQLQLNYGRLKFMLSDEVRASSNKILTIERSSIGNKIYNSGRPTGFTLDAAKGRLNWTLGVYSTEDEKFMDGWNGDLAYSATLGYQVTDEWKITWDGVYNSQDSEENFLGYHWASTISAAYEKGRFGFLGEAILGENIGSGDRGGHFYGLVAMPSYWLIDKRLQAVAQYQYAGASRDEGFRINSRYVRAAHDLGIDTNSGRGDEDHSIYLGLNYYLCGDSLKIMAGVAYDHLDTPDGSLDAFSNLIALRVSF